MRRRSLFGHGLLFSGWMFRPQVEALSDRYRCVTIDWRGQGESRAAAPSYDMDASYDDAVALIGKLDVGPVHWVGLSMGGFVGMRVAARRGELLRSLTLLDTSAAREDPSKISQYKLLARIYQILGVRPVFGKVSKLMFGPTFLADPASKPVLDELVSRVNASSRAGVRQAILGVIDRLPIEAELVAITVPTLVATGTDDFPTPRPRPSRSSAGSAARGSS